MATTFKTYETENVIITIEQIGNRFFVYLDDEIMFERSSFEDAECEVELLMGNTYINFAEDYADAWFC